MAIEQYDMLPKEEIVDQFEGVHPPDFSNADEPHSSLAAFPLPVKRATAPSPNFIQVNHVSLILRGLPLLQRQTRVAALLVTDGSGAAIDFSELTVNFSLYVWARS